jgi:hypothetical protein
LAGTAETLLLAGQSIQIFKKKRRVCNAATVKVGVITSEAKVR